MHPLRCVLSALRDASVTANCKKSHIGCATVHYLGFRIGGGWIWAIPKNVPQLPTKKELQCGWQVITDGLSPSLPPEQHL